MTFPTSVNTGPQSVSSYTNAATGTLPAGTAWQTSGGWLKVTGTNVTLNGFYVPGQIVVESGATNCLIENCIVEGPAGTGTIRMNNTGGTLTVTNSRICGLDSNTNRTTYGIKDASSGATLNITGCDIYYAEQAIYLNAGYVKNSYIHDLGFVTADHSECIYLKSGNGVTISGNTIFNALGQTACVYAGDAADTNTNCTLSGNLLAGGGPSNYVVVGHTFDTGWTVTNNAFSQLYAQPPFGVWEGWETTGGTWSGNYWNESGTSIPHP